MMERKLVFFVSFLSLVLFPIRFLAASEIKAGLARLEITPPIGYAMAGYGARQGISKSIHDSLFTTVLVLRTSEDSLALVTADLVTMFSPRVEREIQRNSGIRHVLLSSSHTHSGPLPPLGGQAPEAMRVWWHETESKMIRAVTMADEQIFSARIYGGTGQAYIGHNRRRMLANGTVETFWRNAEMLPTAPVDPTVSVLRVDDSEGKLRALVVNYSCHPTVLGPDNLEISADYVALSAYNGWTLTL